MQTKRIVSLFLAVILVVSCLAGCGNTTTTETPASTGTETTQSSGTTTTTPAAPAVTSANDDKTAVIYASNVMTTLNFYLAPGYPDRWIATNVYETLIELDNDGNIIYDLAESIDVEDGGMKYVVHLVKDAKFHNGEALTAKDVVFTLGEYAPNYPLAQQNIRDIESVVAVDDYTVEIKMATVNPIFITLMKDLPIFCESYVKAASDPDMKMEENGSGPYKVTSFDGTNHCYLEAWSDYRKGEPAVKKAEIRYIADASSASVAFEAGEITVMDAPIAQGKILVESGKYNYEYLTPLHTAIIAFNCQKAPFDNKLVRQAFSYAADKETMIKIAYDGMAVPADMAADTNCFGVDYSKANRITYDPEKAKALLAEAGYPDGLDLTAMGIEFKTIAGGYHEKIAQIYQENLKAIGVTVELVATETPDDDCVAGDYFIMNEGQGYKYEFAGQKTQYHSDGVGGSNFGQWSDPEMDAMWDELYAIPNREDRVELYKDMCAYIIDACPTLPIFHRQAIYLYSKDLNASFYNDSGHPYRIWEWSWN